jgi:RNA polymerase sigma-70 factor (ECF subfamily)
MVQVPHLETSPVDPEAADQSDEQCMTMFAGGKTAAFTILFSRYKQPLFGFFRRRILSPANAEELTQETFLVVLRSASAYQPEALFRTYIYSIAFNVLRTYRRKTAFRATFLGIVNSPFEPSAPSSLDDDMAIRQALARLGSIDREILLLREFEQLAYAEIATLLNLPLNTVRSRLFRARMALREILAAAPKPIASVIQPSEERL